MKHLPCGAASEKAQKLQQAHCWLNDLITERMRLLNRQQAHAHRTKPSAFVIKQMNLQQQQRIEACEQHLEKKSFAELRERLLTIPSIGNRGVFGSSLRVYLDGQNI